MQIDCYGFEASSQWFKRRTLDPYLIKRSEWRKGTPVYTACDWAKGVPPEVPIVIVGGTGLYFSALLRGLDRRWEKPPPEYPVVSVDRETLRTRIAARLDAMLAAGLEEEKRRLHERYPVWSRTASLAIGYRDGDDRERIFYRTCQLAKRQDTWFRHQATPLYVAPTVDAVRACWLAHGPTAVRFHAGEEGLKGPDGISCFLR